MRPLTDVFGGAVQDDRALAMRLLAALRSWSYQEVRLPAWLELDRIAAALGHLGAETCKFIAPDQRVLVLLPDPTLGVIAEGLVPRGDDQPRRLCYWADAYRATRQWGWSRIAQVGAELLGPSSAEADAEVLAVAIDAVLASGRSDCRVIVNDVTLAHSLCDLLRPGDAERAREALATGDFVTLQRLTDGQPGLANALRFSGTADDLQAQLAGLVNAPSSDSHRDIGERVAARARHLARISELVKAAGYDVELIVDISLVREIGYYDGFVFQILEQGSGELLAGGGRYDRLLQAFGLDAGGAGFACNVMTLSAAGPADPPVPDYLVRAVSPAAMPRAWQEAGKLRRLGFSVRIDFAYGDVEPDPGLRAATCRRAVIVAREDGVERHPVGSAADPERARERGEVGDGRH